MPTNNNTATDRSQRLVCYKIIIGTKYAAERAYHDLKALKDFRQLFSFIKHDAQCQASYFIRDKQSGRHLQLVSPSTISIHFHPQVQDQVKLMLKKHGKQLNHFSRLSKVTRIDVQRTEQDLLFLDFTA